ncbi:MAG: PspC domain-containing protein [Marmoricola sp.]
MSDTHEAGDVSGSSTGGTGTLPGDGPRFDRASLHDLDRLRRSRTDRYVAGVAGGLGRHFGIDPAIVRVLFVVLTFFGGASIPVYLACWLLVPEDGRDRAAIATGADLRRVLLISAGVIAVLAFLGDAWGGFAWHVWPLVAVALVVVLVASRHQDRRDRRDERDGLSGVPPTAGPGTAAAPVPAYVAPGRPRRTGLVLFWPTLALVAVGLGLLGLWTIDHPVAPGAWAALALALVGGMLVVGAFVGRPGGLAALGIVLVPVLLATTAVGHGRFSDHEFTITPPSAAAVSSLYDEPNGSALLDLSRVADVAALDGRTITVRLDAGRLRVLLPPGAAADVDARIRYAGSMDVDGREVAGVAPQLRTTVPATGPVRANVDLVVRSRVGRIEIERP